MYFTFQIVHFDKTSSSMRSTFKGCRKSLLSNDAVLRTNCGFLLSGEKAGQEYSLRDSLGARNG
jgi:hypothetical protein